VKIALDLAEIANNNWQCWVVLVVKRYINGKMVEGWTLADKESYLDKPPHIVNNLLTITITLDSAMLSEGRISRHWMEEKGSKLL
jgi:hypothetical protein